MEMAPLTLAHSHARSASRETQLSNYTAASSEHEVAAGQFAKAAQSTADCEALRTLKLLEEQHQTLARIIKARHSQPQVADEQDPAALVNAPAAAAVAASSSAPPTPAHGTIAPGTASPTTSRRPGTRDLSSSIVRNLATARGRPPPSQRRGIPSLPEVSTHNAGGRVYSASERTTSPRSQGQKDAHNVSADTIPEEAADSAPAPARTASASDEASNHFLSTFAPILSKMSATAIGFASLPLNPPKPPESKSVSPSGACKAPTGRFSNDKAFDDLDLSNYISPAALRALRDDVNFPATHESFYVVPPSGGTVSYAGILQQRGGLPEDGPRIPGPITGFDDADAVAGRQQQQQQQSGGVHHSTGPNNDVVSAHSSLAAAGATPARRSANASGSNTTNNTKAPPRSSAYGSKGRKTGEELEGENAALRQLLDEQSRVLERQGKRLQMWEAQSQSQTAAAMAQSFMVGRAAGAQTPTKRRQSPAAARKPAAASRAASSTAEEPAAGGVDDAAARIRELEARLAVAGQPGGGRPPEPEVEVKKLRAEVAKLQAVVAKYRERWEQLKEGARSKQREKEALESAAVVAGGDASVTAAMGSGVVVVAEEEEVEQRHEEAEVQS